MKRIKLGFCIGLLLLTSIGCSDRMDLHRVTGTVKYGDGSVPQGEMATITFVPTNAMDGKGASSTIESDGTFQLWTLEPGDGGALAGDYRVTLSVTNGYPNLQHQVAREFTDLRDTPLKATVVGGEDNEFDFVVEKLICKDRNPVVAGCQRY